MPALQAGIQFKLAWLLNYKARLRQPTLLACICNFNRITVKHGSVGHTNIVGMHLQFQQDHREAWECGSH
eukprot:1157809-Pelagomonas_calceolata.AAC.16